MESANLTLKEFLGKTAGNEPVPGGGSISALNGAIAAALAEMVANLTIGRKKYADVDTLMQTLAPRFRALQEQATRDIDRDAEAYDRVFGAFKMSKETDEEKAARREAIQRATKHAAQVPMEVARAVAALMPDIDTVGRKGNQNAVTDACVAMMCARNAVLGALLNVRINLTSLDDTEFARAMADEADRLEREALQREADLLAYVKQQLA
ncbi:MAG: cyclodeaminase/cyclohydrolase family protein [Bacteroidaceae bacterium]